MATRSRDPLPTILDILRVSRYAVMIAMINDRNSKSARSLPSSRLALVALGIWVMSTPGWFAPSASDTSLIGAAAHASTLLVPAAGSVMTSARASRWEVAAATPGTLDLEGLEKRLVKTKAIGFLSKLSLKGKMDGFVRDLRAAHGGASEHDLEWERPNGESKMQIGPCRGAVCGKLVWLKTSTKDVKNPDPSKRDRSLVGVTILYDLKPSGTPGEWSADLYDAQNGKTYKGSVKVEDGKLDMKGCVAIFCDDEKWTRSKMRCVRDDLLDVA